MLFFYRILHTNLDKFENLELYSYQFFLVRHNCRFLLEKSEIFFKGNSDFKCQTESGFISQAHSEEIWDLQILLLKYTIKPFKVNLFRSLRRVDPIYSDELFTI